jgi:glycosyltransferase involved in cell wall biosynthesis
MNETVTSGEKSKEKEFCVGIDLAPLTYTMTGIGVYVQQLVESDSCLCPQVKWHFPVISELPVSSLFRWCIAQNLRPETVDRVTIWPEWGFRHNSRIQKRLISPERLKSGRFELFHVTNSQSQFDLFDMPYVFTVHDLAWMRVPRSELPKPNVHGLDQLQTLIHNAAHGICDSECTRTDVLEFCNRRPQDVSTVLLAPRPGFYPKPVEHRPVVRKGSMKRDADRPYFLAVSTIEPRKNFVRLIQAFAELHRRFPEYQRSLQVRNAVRGRTCGLRLTDSSCLAYHCAWPSQRCKGS